MGLEIVSLIPPCIKNLSASESHQLRHHQGVAGVVCWWQDQNPPHIAPGEFSLKVNLAALTMPVSVVPLTQSGRRDAIILMVETTAVNAPCSASGSQHGRSATRVGTKNPYQNRSQWLVPYFSATWRMSPFGPRELSSFKHCYACTDTDWLGLNSIDQLAQMTVLQPSHYSAAPMSGQLKLFFASFNAVLVVCISLVSLTVCTVGRF